MVLLPGINSHEPEQLQSECHGLFDFRALSICLARRTALSVETIWAPKNDNADADADANADANADADDRQPQSTVEDTWV